MARPFHPLHRQRLAYHRQRCQARFRGEPWSEEFTFEQWWQIWEPNWHRRGTYVMCLIMRRLNTTLPWHQNNVGLISRSEWLSANAQKNRGKRYRPRSVAAV